MRVHQPKTETLKPMGEISKISKMLQRVLISARRSAEFDAERKSTQDTIAKLRTELRLLAARTRE